jgi:hypothetical protein
MVWYVDFSFPSTNIHTNPSSRQGLINPNMWLRWVVPESRAALNVGNISQCKVPLAEKA